VWFPVRGCRSGRCCCPQTSGRMRARLSAWLQPWLQSRAGSEVRRSPRSIGEAAGRLSSSDDGRLLHPLLIARRQVTGLRLSAGSAVGWRSTSSGRGPTLTNAAPAAGDTTRDMS